MALIKCAECGHDVSDRARRCPNCGAKIKKPAPKGCVVTAILAVGAFIVFFGIQESQRVQQTPQRVQRRASLATFPPAERILAQDQSGRWLIIDFLAGGDALAEAQRCVRSRPNADAVACVAFKSRELYRASGPVSAGNFKGGLCYEARWQRNVPGEESGGRNSVRILMSGGACPE